MKAINDFIQEITKSSSDSSFTMNLEKAIQSFNRPFTKLHKLDAQQVRKGRGKCCNEFVRLEICERSCILEKCVESGTPIRFDEVKGKNLTGEELTLIVSAFPVRDEYGNIVSVVEVHRDVTDEAKIHEKYKLLLETEKKAKEQLEFLVDERTKQLQMANEELKKAEAHLVHSEKMSSLGQMVAGLAHELNNPINFIKGNATILNEYSEDIKEFVKEIESKLSDSPEMIQELGRLKGVFDIEFIMEDLKKICSSIVKGTERAADVITGLRTFSRLDEADLKETDIHNDIDTTLMILKGQISQNIRIHKSYDSFKSFVCRSSQLNQVYMNLLQNAIHAVKGNGDIYITTKMHPDHLAIEIKDSGMGIAPENLKKIFDPFFTTKPVGEGTGLGLSVSYGIVQKHNGQILVSSKLGEGTTFKVILPIQNLH